MKSPDRVFRELGQLYDFYREIAKFRIKVKSKPDSAVQAAPKAASPTSRSTLRSK